MKIYLINHYNYANRIIKKYDDINDYNILATYDNIEFKPNDSVSTELILNTEIDCNYLICTDELLQIKYRWFVIERSRTRAGQSKYILYRDVIADNLDIIKDATIYIEKGFVQPNNPLIYNSEQFEANQIKQSELLLKDTLGCKWLIGYYNKGSFVPEEGQQTVTITSNANAAFDVDFTITESIADSIYSGEYITPVSKTALTFVAKNYGSGIAESVRYPRFYYYSDNSVNINYVSSVQWNGNILFNTVDNRQNILNQFISSTYPNSLLPYINNKFNIIDSTLYNKYLNANNKIVYSAADDKYYKILVNTVPYTASFNISPGADVVAYNAIVDLLEDNGYTVSAQSNTDFNLEVATNGKITVSYVEVSQQAYKTILTPSLMNILRNEAYCAFAIPIPNPGSTIEIVSTTSTGSFSINSDTVPYIMSQALLSAATAGLDLQLVPYSPLPDEMMSVTSEGVPVITIDYEFENKSFNNIYTLNDLAVGIIFHLSNNEFTRVINYEDNNNYNDSLSVKVINQLYKYRLVSGDYSSAFDFNIAKNNGVDYFTIDIKYKPYNPYIHIQPNFKNLYGIDTNDTRGLICSNSNYSISRGTDAWESYERANTQYANIFNRQIENMDFMQKKQMDQLFANALAGVFAAGASGGVVAGAFNPAAGIITGAITAGISASGAVIDYNIQKDINSESIDYAKDQFNMSLANIKAQPNTLVTTGAQTPNNKVFPMLEVYYPTSVEIEAFKNKLKYNGMSVNVISDNFEDYKDINSSFTYIKGQIIELDLNDDTHMYNAIANEFYKGVKI